MNILYRILMAGASTALFAATVHAQGDMAHCSAITNPAARLACYDQLSGHAAPASPPARAAAPARAPRPTSVAATKAPVSSFTTLRKRSNFDAVALMVEPLPHGLFRLHLADGTAYDTSMEGAHIAKGDTLHIRRSPLGTTFVDMPGQAPIPVRLYRAE